MKKKKIELLHEIKDLIGARDDYLLSLDSDEEIAKVLHNDYNIGQNEIILTLIEYIFKKDEDEALVFLGLL
jgi:hypothetical protein